MARATILFKALFRQEMHKSLPSFELKGANTLLSSLKQRQCGVWRLAVVSGSPSGSYSVERPPTIHTNAQSIPCISYIARKRPSIHVSAFHK